MLQKQDKEIKTSEMDRFSKFYLPEIIKTYKK